MEHEKDEARKPSNCKNASMTGQRIKMAPEIGTMRPSSDGGRWSRAPCHRFVHQKKPMEEEAPAGATDNGDEEEEVVEIEKRVRALKELVPGGEDTSELDTLLKETADYIKALRGQVNLLEVLAQTIDRRKRGR